MYTRSTKIIHENSGLIIETPILVPSFSSKGCMIDKKGKSDIESILKYTSEFITKCCLISSYDLFYGHIEKNYAKNLNLEMIFIDSGGYEISFDFDYSTIIKANSNLAQWDSYKHRQILEDWPVNIPTIIVNYDHPRKRKSLQKQLKEAKNLFKLFPSHLHLFLLKPETNRQTTLNEVLNKTYVNIDELASFDIIGLTEKELGKSMLDKMVNIAKLRKTLDSNKIKKPIHIFGALDPLTVSLYYISGAEIFDGLTWIRYAYHDGKCIYFQNHGSLQYGIHVKNDRIKLRALTDNIYCLEKLEERLKEFHMTNDFNKLEPHSEFLKNSYDSLLTKLNGV